MDRETKPPSVDTKDSNSLESYTDLELVKKFKKGNENGFDVLVKRYQTRIYLLAYRMVHNQEDAWELSQEAFVRAYKSLRKFKEKSSFYTWIYRICFNQCLTFLNKSKKDKNVSSLDTMTEDRLILETVTQKDEKNEPDMIKRQQQISMAISNALGQLPVRQKLVFIMRQYDQLDNDEIAKMLHLSTGGVKSNYHHAIKKLQLLLKEWKA